MSGCRGESDLVETYSDAQLSEYIDGIRGELDKKRQMARVINLSAAYVSKAYYNYGEVQDMMLAVELAHSMNIRTPLIRRTLQQEDGYECIFDRVQGPNLMDAWAGLGWIATIRLSFQLRRAIQRMRSQTNSTAGSLGTGMARTFWLEDKCKIPPRPSSHAIMSIVNFWQNVGSFREESKKTKEQHESTCQGPLKLSQPLVFTHHDLAPRNLMLDSAGDLCLIDWDYAGWYPPFFEYAGMDNFDRPQDWGWMGVFRWKVFTWIAAGFYSKETRCLNIARGTAIRFRAARKFNAQAGATPSTRSLL
ncbi:hypothetical protein ANO14919_098550 [Xylariales sp. No.14919]|nr:hypothetical protein ANO14919_098550 [Xylariales sp. No.14919]